MKRSRLPAAMVGLQVLLGVCCLVIVVYLLVLSRSAEVVNGANAGEAVAGLRSAAELFVAPALLYLIGAYGMAKGKRWGWWLSVLLDGGYAILFAFSIIEDGMRNIDPSDVAFAALFVLAFFALLLPGVRKVYWAR